MIISSYYHTIILSSHHSTKWLKSFSVPSLGFRHILSHLPLLQGSLPKNKGSWGNNFSRRTCLRGLKNHSPFKTSLSWKKNRPPKLFFQKSFRRRKIKSCKSSETRFAKVSRRSEPCSTGKRPFEVSKKNERTNERANERKNEWTNKQTNQQTNQPTNQRNKQTN